MKKSRDISEKRKKRTEIKITINKYFKVLLIIILFVCSLPLSRSNISFAPCMIPKVNISP